MTLGIKKRSRLTNCGAIHIAALRLFLGLLLILSGSLASQAHPLVRMVEYRFGAFVEISPNYWIEVKKGDAIWAFDSSLLELGPGIAMGLGIGQQHPLWPRIVDADSNVVLLDTHRGTYVVLSLDDSQILSTRDSVTGSLTFHYSIVSSSGHPGIPGSSIDWPSLHTFAEPANKFYLGCNSNFTLFNISTRTFYGVPVSGAEYYYPSPQADREDADILRLNCGLNGGVNFGSQYHIETAYTGDWPHSWIRFNWLGAFRYGIGYYTTGPGSGGNGYPEQYEWQIVGGIDRSGERVAYGDKIALRNVYYNQYLVADPDSEQLWTVAVEHRDAPIEAYDWIILPVQQYQYDRLADSRVPGESPLEQCRETCDRDYYGDAVRRCDYFCPAAFIHLTCALACEVQHGGD